VSLWWAEHAWLGGPAVQSGVLLSVKGERFVSVTPSVADPPPAATRLRGMTLPGMANVHSHVFHRALRGRTQDRRGSFWSWREIMYGLANRLEPDSFGRLARAVFAEMLVAGFTAVGEFHYLHHPPGGGRYADPNEMGSALVEAAAAAGIRLTLLDTCYLSGGFDSVPLGAQLRFSDGTADAWAERVSALQCRDGVRLGAALHSVRAVPAAAITQVVAWAETSGWPLHAHVSEQRREVEECVARLGRPPLAVLADHGAVHPRFTAVHGTHLTAGEVGLLGRAGAGCCLCPTTERDLGDGIGPARDLHEAGVALCIGTDSHAVIDGFEEARAIELDARLQSGERNLLSSCTLLHAATRQGMAALGWDAGSIEAGRLADFVTVRLDTPRTAGADPSSVATAVFAATAADVDVVVVGGVQLVGGGVHLQAPDLSSKLETEISRLWS
jgi:formiminoglutamate deiminase